MAESAPALKVEDIHKSFGNIKVLRGISLEAFDHDVISILGSSGSGKSTLLRCINLLETPTSGNVYVRGQLIKMSERRTGERVAADRKQVEVIRSKLAMVFQQFNLWAHMTVSQNVTEAPIHVLKIPKAEAKEKAEAILQRVGMYDHRNYYPAQLSGGQQQRAAIARALAMEPDILLLDEPMAGMNVEEKQDMSRFILDVSAEFGTTIVLIEHDMGVVMDISDRVVVLDYGRKIGDGAPNEVRDNPDVISAYLGVSHE